MPFSTIITAVPLDPVDPQEIKDLKREKELHAIGARGKLLKQEELMELRKIRERREKKELEKARLLKIARAKVARGEMPVVDEFVVSRGGGVGDGEADGEVIELNLKSGIKDNDFVMMANRLQLHQLKLDRVQQIESNSQSQSQPFKVQAQQQQQQPSSRSSSPTKSLNSNTGIDINEIIQRKAHLDADVFDTLFEKIDPNIKKTFMKAATSIRKGDFRSGIDTAMELVLSTKEKESNSCMIRYLLLDQCVYLLDNCKDLEVLPRDLETLAMLEKDFDEPIQIRVLAAGSQAELLFVMGNVELALEKCKDTRWLATEVFEKLSKEEKMELVFRYGYLSNSKQGGNNNNNNNKGRVDHTRIPTRCTVEAIVQYWDQIAKAGMDANSIHNHDHEKDPTQQGRILIPYGPKLLGSMTMEQFTTLKRRLRSLPRPSTSRCTNCNFPNNAFRKFEPSAGIETNEFVHAVRNNALLKHKESCRSNKKWEFRVGDLAELKGVADFGDLGLLGEGFDRLFGTVEREDKVIVEVVGKEAVNLVNAIFDGRVQGVGFGGKGGQSALKPPKESKNRWIVQVIGGDKKIAVEAKRLNLKLPVEEI
ncbi:hypothetical protein HDU76_002667 [Blyttiomyces sp. JEL0837]|nr:hypothetical protein HDU76_002667 [Blyttiomyces sp. JEL0837]